MFAGASAPSHPFVIDSAHSLEQYLPILRAATWVAVDTEADSLHAYPEKVCLIQISTASSDRLIDPLAGFSLTPLLEALGGHELIMHGADYDLRLLRKHHEFVPKSIFDTMLAARLLGLRQFSLSHLVQKYLGVQLEKGPQKANWAIRPLSERMERYARNDTHYLKPLADQLRADLEHHGRFHWHGESCARLIVDSSRHRPADHDSVWRVKGSNTLSRPALAILREVWRWRETEAIAGNKPPFFVLSHSAMVDIAAAAAEQRSYEPFLPRYFSERRRRALAEAIQTGAKLSSEHHPKPLRSLGRRPSEAERKRYMELQRRRDAQAVRLGIDPTLIASRSMLSDLAHRWDEFSAQLMNWQRELLQPDPGTK